MMQMNVELVELLVVVAIIVSELVVVVSGKPVEAVGTLVVFKFTMLSLTLSLSMCLSVLQFGVLFLFYFKNRLFQIIMCCNM